MLRRCNFLVLAARDAKFDQLGLQAFGGQVVLQSLCERRICYTIVLVARAAHSLENVLRGGSEVQ